MDVGPRSIKRLKEMGNRKNRRFAGDCASIKWFIAILINNILLNPQILWIEDINILSCRESTHDALRLAQIRSVIVNVQRQLERIKPVYRIRVP